MFTYCILLLKKIHKYRKGKERKISIRIKLLLAVQNQERRRKTNHRDLEKHGRIFNWIPLNLGKAAT